MDNEDSYADPTSLGFVVDVFKPPNDDGSEGFVQTTGDRCHHGPLLQTLGMAPVFVPLGRIMAMLGIGPVLDFWEARKFIT
ncbi:hypothetical protein P3S67_004295 [Capsicum chacoense]